MDEFIIHFLKDTPLGIGGIILGFIMTQRFRDINASLKTMNEIFNKRFEMVDEKLNHMSENFHTLERSIDDDIKGLENFLDKEVKEIRQDIKEARVDAKETAKTVHENKVELARLKEKNHMQ